MSTKRKRVVLTMADKVEIINLLKDGEPRKKIAEIFGVGAATVSDIKKNSESILQFAALLESESGCSNRKTMRKSNNHEVEEAIYKWFIHERSSGQPMSGPILCEKALIFNKELGGNSDFKASSGWLRNFKSRHGIQELEIHHVKLSHKGVIDKHIQICSDDGIKKVSNWTKKDASSHDLHIVVKKEIDEEYQKDNKCEKEDKQDNYESTPTHNEAFNCLEIVMNWYRKQNECSDAALHTLKCLQDLAARKQV